LTPDTRIPRAAQVRLTENGLRRVEAIAPGLLATFTGTGIPVPRSSQDLSVGKVIICPNNNCSIRVTLPPSDGMRLSFAEPNGILARVRLQASGTIPLQACTGSCNDRCERSGLLPCVTISSPDIQVNTGNGSRPYLGLSTKITVSRDTHAPRRNYHRADVVSPTGMGDAVQETQGEGIEDADIVCRGDWICGIVNLARGLIVNQFRGQFAQALGPIQEALAHASMPNPPGCPTGTTVDGNRCRYDDRTLVPTLLGTEGRGNLGALLASVSPGVNAPVSLVLAAGDPMRDGQVVNGGMSVNVFGVMQSQRHNACVPRLPAPPMPTIPEWNALRMNTVPGTSTAVDLGIGVAEDYLNWSLFQLWDAGMFCLAAGSNLSSMLSVGTFASLPPLSSLRTVIYPNTTGPLAIVLRPQQPPTARIGMGSNLMTDPLIRLTLPRVALDFYAWSEERYVRFMTLTTTITVPVNLQADAMGLTPTLGEAQVDMVTPTVNTQLISNNPALIGPIVQSVLGPALSMLGGSLNPITLPDIDIPGSGGRPLGSVRIVVPPRGVQGVSEGMSRFLGIFAQLQYVPAMARPQTLELDTRVTLDRVHVNRALWTPEGFRRENLPAVTFTASTPNDFGRRVEYSHRVDGGTWSIFSTEARVTVRDWAFVGQGRHTIEVRARAEGEPATADREPARIEFVIDTVPPELSARIVAGQVVATARDEVSEHLEYAFQFDDAAPTPWGGSERVALPSGVERVRVFVRDEAGNEANLTLRVARLIRGGPSTDASSGCGCAVPGRARGHDGAAWLACLVGVGALAARRRRRAPLVASTLTALLAQGCPSSDTASMGTRDGGMGGMEAAACGAGQVVCGGRCVPMPMCTNTCMPGFMPSGMASLNMTTCMPDTSMCTCTELPPLGPGAVGSHLHMAAASDGTLWLSAYSPGDPAAGLRYGDLVVGRWRAEMASVEWFHVDGVPSGGEVTGRLSGWRGGISTPGDDVGQFNSIVVGADNNPRVAYWDATNNRLKFASCMGTSCRAHTVDMNGANGRYASLALVGGVPVIAYRAAVATMTGFNAVVRLARANNPNPMSPADWTITEVASLPSACRPAECATGTVCLRNGRCGPMPMMASEVFDRNTVEALGPGAHYINLVVAPNGTLAVVWYHRDRGNLMLARGDMMGRFSAPVVLDGEGAMMRDTGDRGIYASAAFDREGVLHVAYVDGWDEGLLYLRVRDGVPMGAPETIDDGSGVEATSFDDGRHIVGDSAALSIGTDGTVRVAYQDTTAGTLRLATRGTMGWTRTVLDRMNHTGYWATVAGGNVATYWRDLSMSGMPRYGVRVFPLR
jgi:hypothetical protein